MVSAGLGSTTLGAGSAGLSDAGGVHAAAPGRGATAATVVDVAGEEVDAVPEGVADAEPVLATVEAVVGTAGATRAGVGDNGAMGGGGSDGHTAWGASLGGG